ncbi:putative LrgA family protein [Dinoroseobacter shibae DFL 12 = DSM 16493]|jgi:putative effector of murein hydrolase LrgA (UPF0299 family)|uniref:Putative LrgA family protein n=1 Tax=Dinoroseobacter shibae (strain DSM 16493 / NCIMB 14021 / DFL 12) TaxID=398580 RepID=A8LKR1_DINSH|nr:CidA/LrgA family protein [Dinoroseobacter shibae]ABV91904.1 putative LrgA family protein [Dinoroseobacter shibae DFL 12 = DSM 16493]URF46880.1 CidA/LrgA family protein [Dinoroseobacter shibae]URF51191.1 CidA/LrgA family protein [Dinoroseobacter shibae]
MILHLLVLLVFQLIGEVLARSLGLLVPGPVLGLVLLLGFFLVLPQVAEAVRPTANALLAHLSLLFVPAGVGVVAHLDVLGENGVPLLIALVISTLVAISVGALVFVGVARLIGDAGDD